MELLTDRRHLEMAERLIRGGVSSVFWRRLVTMNNKLPGEFDEKKARTHGLLVDANNLYGGIMQKKLRFLWAVLRLRMLDLAQFLWLQTTSKMVSY